MSEAALLPDIVVGAADHALGNRRQEASRAVIVNGGDTLTMATTPQPASSASPAPAAKTTRAASAG